MQSSFKALKLVQYLEVNNIGHFISSGEKPMHPTQQIFYNGTDLPWWCAPRFGPCYSILMLQTPNLLPSGTSLQVLL